MDAFAALEREPEYGLDGFGQEFLYVLPVHWTAHPLSCNGRLILLADSPPFQ